MPRLHYQTGTATFIQLLVAMFLVVLSNFVGFIQECTEGVSTCAVTAFLSVVIIMFAGLWFAGLSVLGYAAEEKRNARLAKILFGLQLLTAFMALMILRLPGSFLVGISAFITFAIAVWVAVLAFRLSKSKGGRIVQSSRARRRLGERTRTRI